MAEEKFKLPQSSYEELTKVIKAYGHFSEPVSLDEVSKFIGLHTTVISRNTGFLSTIGILESGTKKASTSIGKELALALEHNMPDEIRTRWRNVVSANDFLTRLISAIKIRSGMDQQTLEAHIAYSAGQPKKSQYMTGARTVIDVLKAAELIAERDGKYLANAVQVAPIKTIDAEGAQPPSHINTNTAAQQQLTMPSKITAFPEISNSLAQIKVQVNINCTPADIPDLGKQLRRMLEEISEVSKLEDDSSSED